MFRVLNYISVEELPNSQPWCSWEQSRGAFGVIHQRKKDWCVSDTADCKECTMNIPSSTCHVPQVRSVMYCKTPYEHHWCRLPPSGGDSLQHLCYFLPKRGSKVILCNITKEGHHQMLHEKGAAGGMCSLSPENEVWFSTTGKLWTCMLVC